MKSGEIVGPENHHHLSIHLNPNSGPLFQDSINSLLDYPLFVLVEHPISLGQHHITEVKWVENAISC